MNYYRTSLPLGKNLMSSHQEIFLSYVTLVEYWIRYMKKLKYKEINYPPDSCLCTSPWHMEEGKNPYGTEASTETVLPER